MSYLGTKPQTATQLADNIVTSDKIQAGAVGTTDIADGAVTGAKLENSGVTAGTYGSASAIPAVTVDDKGRVTSVTTNAVSGGVTSLNGQTGAITNTDLYAIGSYVTGRPLNNSTYSPNTTIAGSSLYQASPGFEWAGSTTFMFYSPNYQQAYAMTATIVNTGTWRCVSTAHGGYGLGTTGLWVRIS